MLEKYIQTKIIPVVVVENEDETRKIAELCLEFLPSIELTLRTEYGYKAASSGTLLFCCRRKVKYGAVQRQYRTGRMRICA